MNTRIMHELGELGQAIWFDYIHRDLLTRGELKALVDAGLRGVTSNPTIFEKAINGSHAYDDAMRALLDTDPSASATDLYEALAIEDVRGAADVLRAVYDQTSGADGYVSLEVSPLLAHDTAGTIAEARRLWKRVDRPNLMIKIPGTPEGVPAIEAVTSEGINVNVTLLFSLEQHEAIARAYIRGLGRAADPSKIASVASFFVSRVDTLIDKILDAHESPAAKALAGKLAVANAKRAYALYERVFGEEPFVSLRRKGARVQRPLWASTGTKNPNYPDLLYVETLMGPDTVNTLPPATLDALRDHGAVRPTLRDGLAEADAVMAKAADFGVDFAEVATRLQEEGVELFAASYRALISALEKKRRVLLRTTLAGQSMSLHGSKVAVDATLDAWTKNAFERRLWEKDPTLWSETPVAELRDRLGWLSVGDTDRAAIAALRAFAREVADEGTRHVVLLGMGGSSLAPEVFQKVFGAAAGFPSLVVLDTTHPDAVRQTAASLDLARCLFVVSSKSGTTPESNSLFQFFWDARREAGDERGRQFVAITDPGTPLEKLAQARGFRRVFSAPADVGGRYSALTVFGLVPAALIGAGVGRLVARACVMADACGAPGAAHDGTRTAADNPGLALGAALGVLAREGRDKITFVTPPSLAAFPAWVEQLIAESTGKDNRGILPIDNEALGAPSVYGADRVFVALSIRGEADPSAVDRNRKLEALERAGHPVIRMELGSVYGLGQEIFRWEVAVAAAGAALGIHPFNQPDVQLAKDLARKAMSRPAGDKAQAAPIVAAHDERALRHAAAAFLASAKAGDFVAIHAYLAPSDATSAALESLRTMLRDRLRLATTVGYGPRFLHSTGQLHKGGANNGLFLQLLDEPTADVAVPETDFTFGRLIRAQSDGDAEALIQRGRRFLRVGLGTGAGAAAIERLARALAQA
jgi:transaldolase/glucose-6-phosphate isomerase